MHYFKKRVLTSKSFILIVFMVFIHFKTFATEITLVTLSDYPPFSFSKNGELEGLLIELSEKVSASMPHYTVKLIALPWKDIVQQKFPEGAHGFLGSYFKVAEWPQIYPYSYPIFNEQMTLICHTQTSFDNMAWPSDFKNKKIGHVRDYDGWVTYGARMRQLGTINAFEFPSPELTLLGVYNQVVDCAFFEKTTYKYMSNKLQNEKKIVNPNTLKISSLLSSTSLHIGYLNEQMTIEEKHFIKAFDKAFYTALKNNELVEIYAKYGIKY